MGKAGEKKKKLKKKEWMPGKVEDNGGEQREGHKSSEEGG